MATPMEPVKFEQFKGMDSVPKPTWPYILHLIHAYGEKNKNPQVMTYSSP